MLKGRLAGYGPWLALALAVLLPIGFAVASPLLAWRDPVYIAAGLAGIIALALLLVQPLLIAGLLPSMEGPKGRRAHRVLGAGFILAVFGHVAGLWVTSPPDVIDALLFASPTPFAVWGVLAMWAAFLTGLIALMRGRLRLSWRLWRLIHSALVLIIVGGTVAHAVLIEGTMEPLSKALLCGVVCVAVIIVLGERRALRRLRQRP